MINTACMLVLIILLALSFIVLTSVWVFSQKMIKEHSRWASPIDKGRYHMWKEVAFECIFCNIVIFALFISAVSFLIHK